MYYARTTMLKCGPGISFDILVELTVGPSPSTFAIVFGGVPQLNPNVYDYNSNSGQRFWYDTFYGGVNTGWTGSNGYPQLRTAGEVHHLRFLIRGNTLTFSGGAKGSALTVYGGSWQLPNDFYLLLSGSQPGYVCRLSKHKA